MANLFYFAFFLCISSEALAQRTPTISHITQEQIRDIGGQVDLQCSVHYSQDFPVIWVKYDQSKSVESIPLSNNANLIIKDSRFSLRFDEATATYTLSIKDIQENDAGWYQCQVLISISNKIAAEVELQVRRPPIVSDNSTRSVVASEGESVQMECYAGGFPAPKISWRRENNAILPTGGSIYRGNILRITSVHKEDRGTYYCVAENGVGKGARRNINLEVEFAPVVQVPKPRLAQWQIDWQKKNRMTTTTGQTDDTIKKEKNSVYILLKKLDAFSSDVGATSSMRHSIPNEAHLRTNNQAGEGIIHQSTENYPKIQEHAFNPAQCTKRENKLLLEEHLKIMRILDEEKEIKLMILNEQLKFVKEENEIKKKILEEQQREAKSKADLAHIMLVRNP